MQFVDILVYNISSDIVFTLILYFCRKKWRLGINTWFVSLLSHMTWRERGTNTVSLNSFYNLCVTLIINVILWSQHSSITIYKFYRVMQNIWMHNECILFYVCLLFNIYIIINTAINRNVDQLQSHKSLVDRIEIICILWYIYL